MKRIPIKGEDIGLTNNNPPHIITISLKQNISGAEIRQNALQLKQQILQDYTIVNKLNEYAHDCDCEYGGCVHSITQELLKKVDVSHD